MKKHLFLASLLLSACQQSTPLKQADAITGMGREGDNSPGITAITDPVCGMVKDSTWTDYIFYKGDTVWFCATKEKTAFEANPLKYERNIISH